MAMIRWIIENEKYATNYLIQPNLDQAKLAGEIHWCNATHLVITEKGHKDYGKLHLSITSGRSARKMARYKATR